MKRVSVCLFALLVLVVACGLKPDLPSQIPETAALEPGSYYINHIWQVPDVSEMLVHSFAGRFYVAQHDTLLSIFPLYYSQADETPRGNALFEGIDEPQHLAGGHDDAGLRLWVFDALGDTLKGFDAESGTDTVSVRVAYHDAGWSEIVAIAADDAGHVFVADRFHNRVFRYVVTVDGSDIELEPDGEIVWSQQGTGARVKDLIYAAGKLILLDDELLTLQILDPEGVIGADWTTIWWDPAEPVSLAADENHIFVLDNAGDAPSVWQLNWDLSEDDWRRVNEHEDTLTLKQPTAVTVNQSKVYISDRNRGWIFDYEIIEPESTF